MSKEYTQAWSKYQAACQTAKEKSGSIEGKTAMVDKRTIMNDIRQMERDSARAGVVLNPIQRKEGVQVQRSETSSRQSLREEYVRSFDDKVRVNIPRKDDETFVGTMREYHANRLLKRG